MRTPISCVRRRTPNAITPYSPAAASSSAANPNDMKSVPNTRNAHVR